MDYKSFKETATKIDNFLVMQTNALLLLVLIVGWIVSLLGCIFAIPILIIVDIIKNNWSELFIFIPVEIIAIYVSRALLLLLQKQSEQLKRGQSNEEI